MKRIERVMMSKSSSASVAIAACAASVVTKSSSLVQTRNAGRGLNRLFRKFERRSSSSSSSSSSSLQNFVTSDLRSCSKISQAFQVRSLSLRTFLRSEFEVDDGRRIGKDLFLRKNKRLFSSADVVKNDGVDDGDDDDDDDDDDEDNNVEGGGRATSSKKGKAQKTTTTNAQQATAAAATTTIKSKKTSDLEPITLQSLTQEMSFGAGVEADDLTPTRVVEMLDDYIIGQKDAKRAVAVALRNRWRRHRCPDDLKDEIVPKNILMIGPTGCGKTEIARRLAKITESPFVKVEATKFTEVGFHGRDVDQIIRDLMDNAINLTKTKLKAKFKTRVAEMIENKILDFLCGESASAETREAFRELYREGALDDRQIEVELPEGPGGDNVRFDPSSGSLPIHELVIKVDKMFSKKSGMNAPSMNKRKMTVRECKPVIEEAEFDKLLNQETIAKEAVNAVESDGIVFIDEIDKIVSSSDSRHGADASSEGVQRDLLPIIEGSIVSTKYGNVSTDHILFIASGAFSQNKPSDMLAELQGRLPIRVELKGLTKNDLHRILTEPKANILRQQRALMETEGVELEFTPKSIERMAELSEEINSNVDNIGARRLHAMVERICEKISFDAPELAKVHREKGLDGKCKIIIDVADVDKAIGDLLKKKDLARFVL
jgi:ATP-dependent HslUV protease ATP-binding subunit HslU